MPKYLGKIIPQSLLLHRFIAELEMSSSIVDSSQDGRNRPSDAKVDSYRNGLSLWNFRKPRDLHNNGNSHPLPQGRLPYGVKKGNC